MSEPALGRVGVVNPFGIHYLKFFVAVMLLAVHGLVFVGIFKDFRFETSGTWMMRLLACLPSSTLVPFTAGATQALVLFPKVTGGRLRNFPLGPFIKILVLLAFLESAKAMILTPAVFFGWNVIHTIAVSLILVVLFARLSVHLVWISAAACLVLTPTMRAILLSAQVATQAQVALINEYDVGTILLKTLCLVVAIAVGVRVMRSSLSANYRLRLLGVVLAVALLIWFLILTVNQEYYFTARLLNLPTGALVGDQLGLHYWPLFPWYAAVAGGFSLYYWWARSAHPARFAATVTAASVILLGIYFQFHFDQIAAELDPKLFWGSKLFAGNLWLYGYGIASFSLFAVLFESASRSRRLNGWGERHPALFRIPFVYSKTIFWGYFFVNTAGIPLAYIFAKALPTTAAMFLFPVCLVVSWYWLGEGVISLFSKHRFSIRFARVNHGA